MLYATAWDSSLRGGRGGQRRVSLKHRDKALAKHYAATQHAKLVEGQAEITAGRIALKRLLALYGEHARTKDGEPKSVAEKKENVRQEELFVRVFGGDKDPHRITEAEWQRFVDDRRSGAIDARGRHLADPTKRRPARARTVEYDLKHLGAVLRWGMRWKDREGVTCCART